MDISCEDLRDQIIQMAGLVEAIISKSTDTNSSIKDIFTLENQINKYHKAIDDNCFKFIALKRPVAKDLRIALSIMKINSELERMGDQAVNIKRYHKKLKTPYAKLQNMTDEVGTMVNNCIDSFVHGNTKLATDVILHDQEVNDLNREVVETYLQFMKKNDISFEEGFSIIRVAKNLERIGDLATNVAEDVIFLESGQDIRHTPELKFGKVESLDELAKKTSENKEE